MNSMTPEQDLRNAARPKQKFDWQKLLAPAVLILIIAFFLIAAPNFRKADSLVNVLTRSYFIGFLALGVTFVIITGGIDLSLGTSMCAGMLVGVAFCTVVGLLNGVLIAYLKLPPFIATLGTQMMTLGMGAIATNVVTMRYTDPSFKVIFYKTGNDLAWPWARFPVGALWLVGAFLIAWVVLNRTKFGRYVFAMGSNYEAARLSGIRTRYWLTLVYTLCGFFVGMAGIFYAAVYTSIVPSAGPGYELLAIAGVVIGGTSMLGGSGSLTGTLIGVLTMSVLKNGLVQMGLQPHWQNFFTGVVVIGAVLLDQYRIRQSNKVKPL